MAAGINTYILCYDIALDKFRNKFVSLAEKYGNRFQYSVFICELSKERFMELEAAIECFYNWKKGKEAGDMELSLRSKDDSIALFLICRQCKTQMVCFGRNPAQENDFVVL